MERLLKIGFVKAGYWYIVSDRLKYVLDSHTKDSKVLYCFVADGGIMYIGKTIMELHRRMYGYQNPAPAQSTNMRVNAKIVAAVAAGKAIDIFVLPDNGLLKYGDFSINLAAGLEDILIYEINPDWNFSGKKKIIEDQESAFQPIAVVEKRNDQDCSFDITLGDTYYKQGFFNIGQAYANKLGSDNPIIEIQLGVTGESITGYINRTANTNGNPRIMGGKTFKNWVSDNYSLGDIMNVSVLTPEVLRINV